jgi:hypothetical protein
MIQNLQRSIPRRRLFAQRSCAGVFLRYFKLATRKLLLFSFVLHRSILLGPAGQTLQNSGTKVAAG